MNRYTPVSAICLILTAGLLPGHSFGSATPTSLSLGWGYSQELGPRLTAIPSASATWTLNRHLSLRSNITYLHEKNSPPAHRSYFVPLSLGLRLYAGQNLERTRGMYLDAAPAFFLSKLEDPSGGFLYKAPVGFEVGTGVRMAGFDGSRIEIGMNFYHSPAVTANTANVGPDERGGGRVSLHQGFDLFAVRLAIGFGD
ncbi:MAG TPA: hypothetical protein VER38_05045 [Candidatus Eisenbacteria bacterium]|nr:hypothetical protein [Candidatus Eisenbacteria bacterium]